MLLTLTDGLLPVKKFDRSFREKVHFKDKWRQKQYIWKKNVFFVTRILFQQLQLKIYPLSILEFIKISTLWSNN